MTDSDPIAMVESSRPAASAPKKTRLPTAAGAIDPESHLLVGPGDRVDHGDDHGEQGQGDHHQQECQVPEPGIAAIRGRRQADRHVAEDAGDPDEPDDGQDATERAADQDQQQERADGVGGDPFGREGQSEQDADEWHRHPERGAALPPAGPDRREDRVGRDDEQPDVDIVHADP